MSDENWKDEYKSWKSLRPFQLRLLDSGPISLSQTWLINAMWCDWKEIKKLKDIEAPKIEISRQSSDKELSSQQDPWE